MLLCLLTQKGSLAVLWLPRGIHNCHQERRAASDRPIVIVSAHPTPSLAQSLPLTARDAVNGDGENKIC